MEIPITIFVIIISVGILPVHGTDFSTAKANLVALVGLYKAVGGSNVITDKTQTIPLNDQTAVMTVTLTMNMYAILDFDDVAGQIDIVGSLSMEWTDTIGTIKNEDFDSTITSVMIDYRKIWTPTIVLVNSMDSLLQVGDPAYKARFIYSTGAVTWNPRVILSASCSPDMTYYPFDQQTCSFIFTTWYHDDTMVMFALGSDSWGLGDYDANGVWDVESTSSRVYATNSNYYAEFTLIMKRKPLYFAFNIVLPVLLLSLLSGFVFILPVASGERVGFCVTSFLSFVVLLQTIMQFLPETSSPMSILGIYVVIMMLFTGFVTIVTILLMRVHLKPEGVDVPRWLIHVTELINCTKLKKCCKRHLNKVAANTVSGDHITNPKFSMRDWENNKPQNDQPTTSTPPTHPDTAEEGKDEYVTDVDWTAVGNLLDFFCLLAFFAAQAVFTVSFLLPLGLRYAG